jgi:outer membrane protein assembly factor BamD (BamD/ComL family)
MSVQNISAASDPTVLEDYSAAQAARTKFNQIGKALENGDLAQAQADYSALMKTAPTSVQEGKGPIGQALANLGSAFQSGAVSDAQEAYQFLAQHLRHRRHVASEDSASPDVTAGSSTSGAGGTSPPYSKR